MKRFLGVIVLCALAACPGPQQGGGGGGGGGGRAGISPDSCGKLDTTNIGRKVYQFLIASAELDRASLELERSVHDACKRMAVELGVSPAGTIQDVCTRAATELDANLKVSVKSESRLVTRTVPPVCTTSVEFTAGVVASCEAKATADVDVTCSGRCGGTCSGACDGTCAGAAGGNAGTAQCNGQCQGTCRGRCTGGCDGYVDVNASAECKASAEIRAVTHTECTEAKVEVVRENVTVVDDSKFQKAVAAINAGMPAIVKAGVKLERAGKAVGLWVTTGASLVKASGQLVGELGEKAVCVGGQLAAVVAATANIQARFSVSIEVSAKVSASAGAQSR